LTLNKEQPAYKNLARTDEVFFHQNSNGNYTSSHESEYKVSPMIIFTVFTWSCISFERLPMFGAFPSIAALNINDILTFSFCDIGEFRIQRIGNNRIHTVSLKHDHIGLIENRTEMVRRSVGNVG